MDNKSPEAFRTISEVADWLGVPAHVLRFWESRFGQVKPVKRAGGRRYYRPSDMELLGGIRKLLHEDGMTIRGVQKLLRENGVRYVAAMSPPIDGPGDLRDVNPAEEAAPERPRSAPVRAAPVFDDEVEDAVEAETPPGPDAPSPTPQAKTPETAVDSAPELEPETAQEAAPAADRADSPEDLPPPAVDSPAPTSRAEEVAAVTEDTEAGPPDAPQDRVADDHAPVFDSATQEISAETAAQDHDELETLAPDNGDAPLDDTLEALEFRSHEAEPDTSEGPEAAMDAGVPDATTHASEPAAPTPAMNDQQRMVDQHAETADDMRSPAPADSVPATAPGAISDETPSAGTEDDTDAAQDEAPAVEVPAWDADASAAESAATPPAPVPPGPVEPSPAPGPDLVLPDIGPDPEDDARAAAPAIAARLRQGRPLTHRAAAPARLNPALIQAYADRLQALSGRLGATPDTRRPF